MILAAIVLFCLAVLLGLWLVVLGVRYRRGSRALAAGHAGVALLGLILLGRHTLRQSRSHVVQRCGATVCSGAVRRLGSTGPAHGQSRTSLAPPMMGVSLHAAMALAALLLLVLGYTHP